VIISSSARQYCSSILFALSEFTRQTITKDNLASDNNTFTHCNSTKVVDTTASVSPSAVASSTSSSQAPEETSSAQSANNGGNARGSSSPSVGAIAGIVLGSIFVLGLTVILLWWFRARHRYRTGGGNRRYILDGPDGPEMSPGQVTSYPYPASAPSMSAVMSGGYRPQEMSSGQSPYQTGSTSSRYTENRSVETSDLGHSLQPTGAESEPRSASYRSEKGGGWSHGMMNSSTSGSSSRGQAPMPSDSTAPELLERHTDGGALLGRSASGRLPPAYGDQSN